jgi:hypothetical protein
MEYNPQPKYRTHYFHRDLCDNERLCLLNGLARHFPLDDWIFRYQVHERKAYLQGTSIPAARIDLQFLVQRFEHPVLQLSFNDGGHWIKPDWELSAICEGVHAIPSTTAAISLANKLLDRLFLAGGRRTRVRTSP